MSLLHWSLPRVSLTLALGIVTLASDPLPSALAADGAPPAATEPAATEPAATEPVAFHEQVDQLIEAAAIGPLAPACNDAEFIRRVSLDLTGVIPLAAEVREFLADANSDKRQRLIDDLIASPEFARHMAVQWDVMLLERRSGAHVPVPDWEGYLIASVAADKPLDQLFGELVVGDRLDPKVREATKFLLCRDAEPHAVTRGVGRLAFGMDLQCAQCHDHPLVDDYYQADYYGLHAFLHRISLLKNELSERADGEVNFKSVFTGDARQQVLPRFPKGQMVFEAPGFPEAEAYITKPEKGIAGVPKYSPREALAERLGESRQFQLNVANRVWALVFGRGIVDPLDYHHLDNPPHNPPLLHLLADQLRDSGFRMREMIRQLVSTRAYQRSCDAPQPESINFAAIAATAKLLAGRLEDALAAVDPLKTAAAESAAALEQALEQNASLATEVTALQKAIDEAKQHHEKTLVAQKAAADKVALLEDQAAAVAAAAKQADAAVAKLKEDKELAAAAKTIRGKAEALAAEVKRATAAAAAAETQSVAAAQGVVDAENALQARQQSRVGTKTLKKLEQARLVAAERLRAAEHEHRVLTRRLAFCQTAAEFAALAPSDPAAAEAHWTRLVEDWTIAGQIAPLKPLSPEQLAASAMRATGVLAGQIKAAEAKLEKTPPESLKAAPEDEKPKLKQQLTQHALLQQWRGTVKQFVTHYGGLPGEDFQATVNQALFFGNSSLLAGWLKPAGQHLSGRLVAIEDPAAVADELYISVLSRPPAASETEEVVKRLSEAPDQRAEVIGEMIWALLSSTEFRFNH